MSQAEVADLEQSRDKLAHYEKIYGIVEYISTLHDGITALEKRIQSNNPAVPQNMWRKCGNNSTESLFHEMENFMQAYYDLIDDCNDHPLWERKI